MKVGVILSGCGFMDGAEIQESVCTLLALDSAGAEVICMAPDVDFDVTNHLTGEPTGERRNVLVEAARIARGKIQDVASVSADELDALILPGGFGVAKNLSDFLAKGADATVLPAVASLVEAVHAAGKPIGAICIAPAIVPKLIPGAEVTIGSETGVAHAIQSMGGTHTECPVTDIVVDRERRIVSTPAYMLGPWVNDINQGVSRCVAEVLAMAG